MSSNGGSSGGSGGGGGPCGACKFLRRKCVKGCIFAPYFDSEQGTAHFAAVHKVFGASNASKLLLRIPPHKRRDAVVSLCYEALARLRDPVYGCVSHIFTLQHQVVNLQAELAYVQAKLSTMQRLPPTQPQPQNLSPSYNDVVLNSNFSMSMQLDPFYHPQSSNEHTSLIFNPNEDQPLYDDDLQELGRQLVSRCFPAGVKFRSNTSH
ncbi:hypothetical protein CsatB_011653 [Cannabis sativa]|uniref:LOB domain-containing protein n=1 Tax=Cannabis sativa TaxID=3483 RepID=A0A803NXA0_CANSA